MKGIQQFLLVSGISVILIGLAYGVSPRAVLGGFAGFSIQDNELHIFRAIMGLYCGIGGMLIAGAIYEEHSKAALVLLTVFFGGLAIGRLISLMVDGNSHWFVLSAVGIELPLFVICVILCRSHKLTSG